ncbi:homoserine O-acetyltransferase [Nanobdella aerobiophila]|uniref:Homoserine O-acetyltransferase n=1 Tax=Nanobdella aerobiophila TaxID=2586965 RepID=A0A915WRM6_9ARCH|nr:CBS domain-containing protein [Nanobdella aerobiophila]BBL45858.1 homoserine O-acetyltransferase [Nanobdella aerobiophila]
MVKFITGDHEIKNIVGDIYRGEDIIITDKKGKYLGILSNEKALRYLNKPNTKIDKLIIKIKPIDGDITYIIEKMIGSNTRLIPVKKGDKIEIMNIFDLLNNIYNDKNTLRNIKIEDIKNNAYTIYENDNINKAINIMKENGISRLIVINNENKPVGILTISDILRKLLIQNNEEIRVPKDEDFDIKIKSIIKNNLIFASKKDSIENIIELLVKNKIFSVPILDEKNNLYGIVTAKDILIAYLQNKKEKKYNIVISGIDLDEIDQKYIKNEYERFNKKYSNILGNIKIIIHVKKINENIKDKKIFYSIKARLISDKLRFYVQNNGYDFYSTINDIFHILSNEAEKYKHKDEREYLLQRMFKDDIIRYI